FCFSMCYRYLEEKPEMAEHLAAVRAYREAYGV
ncbi:hypothetical protein ACYCFA_23625, partial [Escherichia coli]